MNYRVTINNYELTVKVPFVLCEWRVTTREIKELNKPKAK
jgi:hypothetical protein